MASRKETATLWSFKSYLLLYKLYIIRHKSTTLRMFFDENVAYNVAIYQKKNIKSITCPVRHLIDYP